MNSEFTFGFANTLWIYLVFREYSMKSPSFSRINYEFTVLITNSLAVFQESLWIYYLFCESNMNSLSLFHEFAMNKRDVARINYGLTIFFENLLWIHLSRIPFIFRLPYEFTKCFANSLWIHCLFRELSKNSRGVLLTLYEFSWCFAYILWIHYLVREFIMNLLSFSRIYYLFTIFIADKSRNHLVFRE